MLDLRVRVFSVSCALLATVHWGCAQVLPSRLGVLLPAAPAADPGAWAVGRLSGGFLFFSSVPVAAPLQVVEVCVCFL